MEQTNNLYKMKFDSLSLPNLTGNELIVREGKALDPKEPKILQINGTIETPFRWLEKKGRYLIVAICTILVNFTEGWISLTTDEKNFYSDEITGSLEMHPDFVKFGINTGEQQSSHELAEKIKMWRSCFKDKDTAMKLVKNLRNFTAKVNKELEAFKDDRANYALKKSQIVETNLPESFSLVVPIFKGQPKETFEVEININADNLSCSLISPAVNDFIAEHKERIIKEQLELIKALFPDLVIIEV
jgi:hypothetical protein